MVVNLRIVLFTRMKVKQEDINFIYLVSQVYLSPVEGAGLFWPDFLSFACTANSYATIR